ncbi:MAG: methylation-associated defense system AAA family ATPase MAD3 [Pseudonocardiales bacterium]
MITRIEASNYRCFAQLSVDVDRYQVLAGANGSGKTTLLDIPILFGDLLRAQRVADAFLRPDRSRRAPRASSFSELLHGGRGSELVFAVQARLPDDVETVLPNVSSADHRKPRPTYARYELRLEVLNRVLEVAEEYLFLYAEDDGPPKPGVPLQGRHASPDSKWRPVITRRLGGETELIAETTTPGLRLPKLRIGSGQLALASVPADDSLFPAARWLIRLFLGKAMCYDPDWAALRRPAPPGDPPELLPDARNTPWLAQSLRDDDPAGFRLWVDHVRTALPQVSDIDVREREEDHHAYFTISYHGGYRVTSSGLSDGTLQILALSLLPYLPSHSLPQLLVTEEPENGIHPQAIETVMLSLSSILDSQVWISTHSPIALARTELTDILATRLHDDGSVDVIRGEQHPRLRDWRGSIDIGSLFASGVLS